MSDKWTRIKLVRTENDTIEWCLKHFGAEGASTYHDPPARWLYSGLGRFWFRHEEDAVLFALRWV